MTREEILLAIRLAEDFVYDPKESVVFTGKSLRDILIHLEQELENTTHTDTEVLSAWKANMKKFRRMMTSHARLAQSTVIVDHTPALLIREDDASSAVQKCPKGPDYHHPSRRT